MSMQDKRSLTIKTLFFFLLFFINLISAHCTLFPKDFKGENATVTVIPFTESYASKTTGTTSEIEKSKPQVCHVEACQHRFRNYSDIDFREKDDLRGALMFDNVYFGSLFEYLRDAVIRCDSNQIEKFESTLLQDGRINKTSGALKNFPLIKYWLILDKLMKEKHYECFDALVYYANVLVDVLPGCAKVRSSLEATEIRKVKLSTLKHAIKFHMPAELVTKILVDVARRESPTVEESMCLLSIISESLDETLIYGSNSGLPEDFIVLSTALEEFPLRAVVDWLNIIYFGERSETDPNNSDFINNNNYSISFNDDYDDENDEIPPLFVHLAPFYLQFKSGDAKAGFWDLLKYPCDFDLNREAMLVLDRFTEMTNFNSCPLEESFIRPRSEVLKRVLFKFEQVVNGGFVKALYLAVERGALHLLEALLKYTSVLNDLKESDLADVIFHILAKGSLEAAILILTYHPIEKDEFISYWKMFSSFSNIKNSIIGHIGVLKELLQLTEEVQADYDDCRTQFENGESIYRLPEPSSYNNSHFSVALGNYYPARIILARYFGISFVRTRVQFDGECLSSWAEQLQAVNAFLMINQRNTERVLIAPNDNINTSPRDIPGLFS